MSDRPEISINVEPLAWVGGADPLLAELGLAHYASIPPAATPAEPVPVVLLVHGWAGDEAAMWVFKQTIPAEVAIITPRAPIARDEGGHIWFNYRNKSLFQPDPASLDNSLQKLERFMRRLPRHYPVDPTQLVLIGFSQGAMMCNAFAINNPFEALGVASLAGAVLPLADEAPESNWLAGLPVFIGHGTRDEVIPVTEARKARQIFTDYGADVTYGEYPAAHKLHIQGIKDLKKWLTKFFPNRE